MLADSESRIFISLSSLNQYELLAIKRILILSSEFWMIAYLILLVKECQNAVHLYF